MRQVLIVHSSPLADQSVTRQLTAQIQSAVCHESDRVLVRDLVSDPLSHWPGASNHDDVDEFLRSDIVIIGAPMYNFSIPSSLKSWIDRVAVAGKTFRYTENGPQGLAGGKTIWVASARGGIYGDASPMDFQENYLKTIFGFLGVQDVRIVRAEGIGMGEDAKKQGLANAGIQLTQHLRQHSDHLLQAHH